MGLINNPKTQSKFLGYYLNIPVVLEYVDEAKYGVEFKFKAGSTWYTAEDLYDVYYCIGDYISSLQREASR